MLVLASFASQLPALVGAVAAGMAIGGFLSQARSAIEGAGELELRRKAAVGGLIGLCGGFAVGVLSVTLST